MEKFTTSYKVAAHWLHNSLILCNSITEVDPSIIDNSRFEVYDEENDSYTEIYQYFLTDCSESDVEFLEDHFGLLFTYSDVLDLFVLCVDHYGTAWDGVPCETDLEDAPKYND